MTTLEIPPPPPPPILPEFTDRPLALRSTAEVRTGPDGRPFVFDQSSGRVVALHGPGVRIIELLDGSHTLEGLHELFGVGERLDDPRRLALSNFVVGLDAAGMLDDDEPSVAPATEVEVDHIPGDLPPGFKVRVHLPVQLNKTTDESMSTFLLTAVLGLIAAAVFGHIAVIQALAGEVSGFGDLPERSIASTLVVFPILLVQVAAHEAAHAGALRLFGLPTREIGLRFWFYIVPLPYVSQAAEVFLPQRRQRVIVALAGITVDGLTGLAIVTFFDSTLGTAVFTSWALLHVMVLLVNLNPLLPTDGARAVEAVLGEVSLRQRCIRWARARAMRQPAPPGSPVTLGKQVYGVAALIFVSLLFVVIVVQIVAGIVAGF